MRDIRWLLVLVAGCLPASVMAQPLAPPVVSAVADPATKANLERVTRLLSDGQWGGGIELLRRILESDGDALLPVTSLSVEVTSGFVRYDSARALCHLRLAQAARDFPEALRLYRNQVDALAERLYERGIREHDDRALRQVVDQYFTSRVGDDALYRLGELALERGDYTAARAHWEQISPLLRTPETPELELNGPQGLPLYLTLRGQNLDRIWSALEPRLVGMQGGSSWLAYPDTDLDLAAVRARLVMVSILEGAGARAAIELDLLRRLHPKSEGQLAGRRGAWVELLRTMLDESADWPAARDGFAVETFAGTGARTGQLAEDMDIARRPIWHVELRAERADGEYFGRQRPRVAETESELLSYHPLVHNGLVFVNDGWHVRGFDLRTGAPAFSGKQEPAAGLDSGVIYDHETNERVEPGPSQGTAGVARFTLTATERYLFARLGSPVTAPASFRDLRRPQRGMIVALDMQTQGRLHPAFPLLPPDARFAFEGTPLCDGTQLHAALRHAGDGQVQAAVASFDLRTGKLRRPPTRLCSAETPGGRDHDERTHNLLTVGRGMVYYNTNLGAVAAVDAEDGRIHWVTTYPRAQLLDPYAESTPAHFFRDLNPCLLYRDMLVVAPSDCEHIFCLEAATGRVLWASSPGAASDAVHLLGVVGDRLIVCGDHLYAMDVNTGRVVAQFPAAGENELRGYGRSLIVGDWIYWPTRDALYIFDVARMQPARQEINLSEMGLRGGNLCLADGVLLIAGPDRLTAFNQVGRP